MSTSTEIEKRVLESVNLSKYLTLLVNHINGTQIEALFTSNILATQYMVRIAVNFYSQNYYDNCQDDDVKPNFDELEKHIKNGLNDYELILVKHLCPTEPIYQLQSGNYNVFGCPKEYLTNSVEDWLKKNPLRATAQYTLAQIQDSPLVQPVTIPPTYEYPKSKAIKCQTEWLQHCMVMVDPPLPPLDTFNILFLSTP